MDSVKYVKGSLEYYEQMIQIERKEHKEKMDFYNQEIERLREDLMKEKRPNVYGEKDERNKRIFELYKTGCSKAELANYYMITAARVGEIISKEERRERERNKFPKLLSCEKHSIPFYVFKKLYLHVRTKVKPKTELDVTTEDDILDFIAEAEKNPELYANIRNFGPRYLQYIRLWKEENGVASYE